MIRRLIGSAGRAAYLIRHLECFRLPRRGGLVTAGDSITVGAGSPRYGFLTDDSWVAYIAKNRHVPYGYNGAVRGQSTGGLADGFPALLRRHPDVVVIATGTNDTSPESTLVLIELLVERTERAGAVPVIGTIPPLASMAGAVAQLNDGLRKLAVRRSLRLIDFNAVLAAGTDFKADLSADGKHPNARASRLMAEAAEAILLEVFGGRR